MYKRSKVGRFLSVLAALAAITFLLFSIPATNANAASGRKGNTPPPSAGELQDARSYADEFGVSEEEALRRLRAQEQMSKVTDLLKRATKQRFAGLWIDHVPEFQLIVRLVGDKPVPPGLRNAVRRAPIPVVFRTGAAATQAKVLEKIRSSVPWMLTELPDMTGTDMDVKTGDVVLFVYAVGAAGEEAKAKGPKIAQRLGHPVRVELIDAPEQDANVRGGANLSTCTSGFVVANSAGTRGILTAAHCGNTQTYSGFDGTTTATTFVSEILDADQDVQWHTTPLTEVPEFYADLTTTARTLTGRRLYSSTAVGNTVCHRGKTTGYSCGSVESTTHQPTYAGACGSVACASTYIRVSGPNLACFDGDSGGPWFNGQTAFGIMKSASFTGTAPGQCNFGTYMSTDYISGLGVSLVYGQ